jgi:hypothetical protein
MVTVDTAHIPETDGQILITTEQPPPRRFEERPGPRPLNLAEH